MKFGQPIGLTDSLLRDIHVGDIVQDAEGIRYTIDRYGRAKPLQGGNEIPVKNLKNCEIVEFAEVPSETFAVNPETNRIEPVKEPEVKTDPIHDMYVALDSATDQMLADKLRERGWKVTCTKIVEKIVYEEVTL